MLLLRLPRPSCLPRPLRAWCGVVAVVLVGVVLLAGCASSGAPQPVVGEPRGPVMSLDAGRSVGPVDGRRPVPVDGPAAVPGEDVPAVAVLRSWDAARSSAFASGDVAALRRLYVAGSPAGTSDVRLLRAYLRRGLRVEGMRMQLLAVEVLDEGDRRLRVRVTDRLARAVAVGHGGRRPLPRDRASTRVVELRRDAREWRVLSVRESARRPAGR